MPPNQSIKRLVWLLWGVLFWAGAIAFRLVSLQVVQHDELRAVADSQHYDTVEVPALRGSIFDRTGQPLAKTLAADSVVVDPQAVPDLRVAADALARALKLDRQKLLRDMQSYKDRKKHFMWVQRKLTPEESLRVRELKLAGVEFRQEMRRYYPRETLAAHVLGSTGYTADSEIERGTAGVEMSLEEVLGGIPGQARVYVDSLGKPYDSITTQAPVPGADITLTIDPNVQYEAERQLRESVQASGARSGSVVAVDPYTGDILAMANYPTYDPNLRPRPSEPVNARNNIAISTPFEPGSVFKVITLTAALESTRLTPQSLFNCGNGVINLFGRVIHDDHKYSTLSMAEVLAHSSNIGAIQIALATGGEALYAQQQRFGFGKRTGVELPGESGGILWSIDKWRKSSIGSLAMGHEVAVTSIQMAMAGAAIANGGLKVKPRLVAARQRAGEAREAVPVADPERIMKPETAIQMRQMMEGVVLQGTGKRAVLQGYTSGGKTGSAQIYDPEVHAYTHTYNASFLGFAPVTNPKIVIAVTLQGTKGGSTGYGGVRAAPVFREVAMNALRIMEVPKDLQGPETPHVSDAPVESDLAASSGSQPDPGFAAALASESKEIAPKGATGRNDVVSSVTLPLVRGGSPVSAGGSAAGQRPFFPEPGLPAVGGTGTLVPDFTGMTRREVYQRSVAAGLVVQSSGDGVAVSQDPPAGAVLSPQTAVRVSFRR